MFDLCVYLNKLGCSELGEIGWVKMQESVCCALSHVQISCTGLLARHERLPIHRRTLAPGDDGSVETLVSHTLHLEQFNNEG